MSRVSCLAFLILILWATGLSFAQPEMPRPQAGFDPNVIFDTWDRNRDGVVTRDEITDRRSLARFEEFSRRAGVTDGRLSREAFLKAFQERMAELVRNSANDAQRILRSLDRNSDGALDAEELQRTQRLRNEVQRWDANQDGRIDLDELRAVLEAYTRERLTGPVPPQPPSGDAQSTQPQVEGNPNLPDPNAVYRPGRLPPGLPDWFARLDVDNDAQIALHEWKGMDLELFVTIDRNGDGILTVGEILRWQAAQRK
jgi:Ca2+-binding EF-hand superfamily protein